MDKTRRWIAFANGRSHVAPGAGYFVNERGDVATFVRDAGTGRWRLRVLAADGGTYEFERP